MDKLEGKRLTVRLSNYNAKGVWYLHALTGQSQNQIINNLLSHVISEELKKYDKPKKTMENILGKPESDLLDKMLKVQDEN